MSRSAQVAIALGFLVGTLPLGSCRTARSVSTFEWANVEDLLQKPAHDDSATAIVVSRERRYLSQLVGNEARTEIHSHDVLKLLTEAGFEHARVEIAWPKKGKLVDLDARSIAPDGTVTPLDPEDIFAAEFTVDDKDGGGGEARFFQFPRVEVGSFVELAYTIAIDDTLITRWSDRVADDMPILDYRAEIVVDADADYDIRIMNSDVKPTLETKDGMKHISFRLQNVPAIVREPYKPSWRAAEPWWLYRTVAYRIVNRTHYMNYNWNDALRGVAQLFKDKSVVESAPAIDVAACRGDPVCVIVAATDKTREVAAFTGFDDAFETRKISEILSSKRASAGDKALLLYAILKKAGIEAHLAGIARNGTNAVAKDFPSLQWLNHTLVVASFDDKLLWIDPSCEHCGPGYLPSWVPIGGEALVAWPKTSFNDVELVNGWWPIAGTPVPHENLEQRTYTIELEEDGDAKVALDIHMTGDPALFWNVGTRRDDAQEQKRDAVRTVKRLSRAAQLTSSTKVECEAAKGACKQRIEAFIPGYAWMGSDAARVPLDPLRFPFDMRGKDSDEPRKSAFVVSSTSTIRDDVQLISPPGRRIEGLPAAVAKKAGLVEVAVTSSTAPGKATIRRDLKLTAGTAKKTDVAAMERVIDAGAAVGSKVVKLVVDPTKTAGATAPPVPPAPAKP